MYSAVIAAQYIILRCNQLGKSISNLKLQKMLYFFKRSSSYHRIGLVSESGLRHGILDR